jgi:hypothetical protein
MTDLMKDALQRGTVLILGRGTREQNVWSRWHENLDVARELGNAVHDVDSIRQTGPGSAVDARETFAKRRFMDLQESSSPLDPATIDGVVRGSAAAFVRGPGRGANVSGDRHEGSICASRPITARQQLDPEPSASRW